MMDGSTVLLNPVYAEWTRTRGVEASVTAVSTMLVDGGGIETLLTCPEALGLLRGGGYLLDVGFDWSRERILFVIVSDASRDPHVVDLNVSVDGVSQQVGQALESGSIVFTDVTPTRSMDYSSIAGARIALDKHDALLGGKLSLMLSLLGGSPGLVA